MNKYIERVLADTKAKNANEPEFLQTVEEVFSSLEPVIDAHPEYEKVSLLERMVEPERIIQFRVVWEDVLAGWGQPWIEFWGGSNCYLIPLDTSPNWLLSPWKRNCRVKLPGTFAGEFRLLRAEFLRAT